MSIPERESVRLRPNTRLPMTSTRWYNEALGKRMTDKERNILQMIARATTIKAVDALKQIIEDDGADIEDRHKASEIIERYTPKAKTH